MILFTDDKVGQGSSLSASIGLNFGGTLMIYFTYLRGLHLKYKS